MQISDLLNQLTPRERRDLAKHALGVDLGPMSVSQLAATLTDPVVVTQGLARMNAAQLRILRWLRLRPTLEAPWSEFVAALGDRLPQEIRDEYVRGLRALALADFNPKDGSGFLATYPAVRAALPPPRLADPREHFEQLNSDTLAHVISAMELSERPTRKAERIDVILRTLTTPESCRALLERRSPGARELFQWLLDRGGIVETAAMQSHVPKSGIINRSYYTSADIWWMPRPGPQELNHPLVELVRCGLVLPISYYRSIYYGYQAYAIAEEVELAAAGLGWFDRAPMVPPPLLPAEQAGGDVPLLGALLRDLMHLVGFVESGRCEFKLDGEPYKRSLTALGKLLGRPDSAYTELLWDLAVGAGLLQRRDDDAPTYVVPASRSESPTRLILRVVTAWMQSRASQVTPNDLHMTPFARQQVLALLTIVPADTWMTRASLDAWLRFRWPLAFGRVTGSDAGAETVWSSLGRFLVGCGTDADGRPTIMMPAEHQRLLLALQDPKAIDRFESPVLPPWDKSVTVQADRTILAPPNAAPDAIRDLWQVAVLHENHGASVFRISAETVAGALNRGHTPAAVRSLLESRARVPLPTTVARLIDDQGQRYGRIKVGRAMTYISTDDPTLLDQLAREQKLKKLGVRIIAPGVGVVEGQDRDAVMLALRGAGHLPVVDGEPAPPAPPARPALTVVPATAAAPASGAGARKPLAPSVVRRQVREAIKGGLSLHVDWLDGGTVRSSEVDPIDLHGHLLHAYDLDDDAEIEVPLDAVVSLALGGSLPDDDVDDPIAPYFDG